MDTMEMIGIVLLVLGFVLAGIEMYVPGFGVAGVGSILSFAAGIVFVADDVEQGLTLVVVIVVLLAIMLTIFMVFLSSKKKVPFMLDESVNGEQSFISASDLEYLVGRQGIALTDLKPSGKCDFDGIEFDVRADGHFVEKGSKVKISRVQGNVLIIKKIHS